MIIQASHRSSFVRKLRAIMFLDLVKSTSLIEKGGDDAIRRWIDFIEAATKEAVPAYRGRMVKSTGDGLLLEFESVADAVAAAVALVARVSSANAGLQRERHLRLRVGINVADIVVHDYDVFGHGVNVAARICDIGGPQEIIVSAAVRDQLTDGLDVTFEDLGEPELKGITHPVRVYRMRALPAAQRRLTHAPPVSGARPSIAVIPFQQQGAESAHSLIGDVMADDLIRTFSHLSNLVVISRLSTSAFRDRGQPPGDLAKALNVRYVLGGTVQFDGRRMRVSAHLTDAEKGKIEWSKLFNGDIGNLFELQDTISHQIATIVVPLVHRKELERARAKRPDSLSAYECMLLGIDHLHRSSTTDMEIARSMFDAAIETEPDYADPYAWLARWHVLKVGQDVSTDLATATREANQLAATALDRDPHNSWALAVQGQVDSYLKKELTAAIERFEHAIELNPSAPSAWVWSTAAHAWLGRGAEAIERSRRAIELSPFDPHMYYFRSIAATAHAVDGRYDEAIELCRRSLRLNRKFTSTHRILAISLALAGRTEEAREAGAELLKEEKGLTVKSFRERYPGSASEHAELFCEGLRKAGIPP